MTKKMAKASEEDIDPTTEAIDKLKEALSKSRALEDEESKLDRFLNAGRAEIESYALSGDLEDQKSLSAIVLKRLQVELATLRLSKLKEVLQDAVDGLAESTATARQMILGVLYQIRNGHVEQAAREMEKHFVTIGQARRQAFGSEIVRKHEERIFSVENDAMNRDPEDRAADYIELAPSLAKELTALREQLGGEIPSENELRAP